MEFNPDRKFPWSIEQVEEVASKFFDKAPGVSSRDKWARAAQEAVDYLNARRNACERALRRHVARLAQPWSADRMAKNLSQVVGFEISASAFSAREETRELLRVSSAKTYELTRRY
jgi:hypothetical protein